MTDPMESADKGIERAQHEVFEPAYTAYQFRVQGKSWREVADLTGYATEYSAAIAVRQYLQTAAVKVDQARRDECLHLEIARLDELQNKWWEAAIKGDEKAANVVLKIIQQRSKLLQLEAPSSESSGTQTTILVAGSNKDYVKKLKEIVNSKTEPEDED